jgi:hypothetical protein
MSATERPAGEKGHPLCTCHPVAGRATCDVHHGERGQSRRIDFIRESDRPEDFDGRWLVFIGGHHYGTVRKGEPVRAGLVWGYETKPFGRWKRGVRCEAGYRTRQAAAEAMVHKMTVTDPADEFLNLMAGVAPDGSKVLNHDAYNGGIVDG